MGIFKLFLVINIWQNMDHPPALQDDWQNVGAPNVGKIWTPLQRVAKSKNFSQITPTQVMNGPQIFLSVH